MTLERLAPWCWIDAGLAAVLQRLPSTWHVWPTAIAASLCSGVLVASALMNFIGPFLREGPFDPINYVYAVALGLFKILCAQVSWHAIVASDRLIAAWKTKLPSGQYVRGIVFILIALGAALLCWAFNLTDDMRQWGSILLVLGVLVVTVGGAAASLTTNLNIDTTGASVPGLAITGITELVVKLLLRHAAILWAVFTAAVLIPVIAETSAEEAWYWRVQGVLRFGVGEDFWNESYQFLLICLYPLAVYASGVTVAPATAILGRLVTPGTGKD
jgi:hypothetical protein